MFNSVAMAGSGLPCYVRNAACRHISRYSCHMLTIETIQEALTTQWLGHRIHFFSSVSSTNDLLNEMAEQSAPAGTMVLTDYQSMGRGRMNRRWEAPTGSSLLVSLLFRPNWPAEQAHWLTMIGGLAVVSAVRQQTNLEPSLKWPNDLILQVGDEWRKFAGLLLEGHFEQDFLTYAILGSGINVNIAPEDLPETATPATSLLAASGQTVNRLTLLNNYLMELERLYEAADAGHSPRLAWEEMLITLGRPVQVSGSAGKTPLEGTAEAVDEWGRLLVRDKFDKLHTIAAGDVSLRG